MSGEPQERGVQSLNPTQASQMPGAVLFTLAAYLGSSTLLVAPVRTCDLWRVGSLHDDFTGVLTPNFATQYVGHREATPWASLGGQCRK